MSAALVGHPNQRPARRPSRRGVAAKFPTPGTPRIFANAERLTDFPERRAPWPAGHQIGVDRAPQSHRMRCDMLRRCLGGVDRNRRSLLLEQCRVTRRRGRVMGMPHGFPRFKYATHEPLRIGHTSVCTMHRPYVPVSPQYRQATSEGEIVILVLDGFLRRWHVAPRLGSMRRQRRRVLRLAIRQELGALVLVE